MNLKISGSKTIAELQKDFQQAFPYLKIEVFKHSHAKGQPSRKEDMIPESTPLSSLINDKEIELALSPDMTTASAEKLFKEQAGLNVQIFRRSGDVWIETSRTDDWSLAFQNEEGRKSTLPVEEEQADLGDRDKWE
ncbi:MAG: hypothetical protein RMJ53_03925 [Chitinophagales bacterium]|nr:hypothetical protein [Chitinophagales bacterium]MDW8273362.1 hypothetical protein [Chitinophagales bacterium]